MFSIGTHAVFHIANCTAYFYLRKFQIRAAEKKSVTYSHTFRAYSAWKTHRELKRCKKQHKENSEILDRNLLVSFGFLPLIALLIFQWKELCRVNNTLRGRTEAMTASVSSASSTAHGRSVLLITMNTFCI